MRRIRGRKDAHENLPMTMPNRHTFPISTYSPLYFLETSKVNYGNDTATRADRMLFLIVYHQFVSILLTSSRHPPDFSFCNHLKYALIILNS